MGRHPATVRACIRKFTQHLENDTFLSQSTINHYRHQCVCVFNFLHKRSPDIMPYSVTEDDVRWFIKQMIRQNFTHSTMKSYYSALCRICAFYKNDVPSKMHVEIPEDDCPHADWLTLEQAKQLLALNMTPPQELVIHLELCMGLRRVEVARLRMQDIFSSCANPHLLLIGKGKMGGKRRKVPFHADTQRVLDRYLDYRDSLITRAKTLNGDIEVPDNLLINYYAEKLRPYSDKKTTGIDSILDTLESRLDFKFSNHTLRRTCGRQMWEAGASVYVIKVIFGHAKIDTTIRYLGLNFGDAQEAMRLSPMQRPSESKTAVIE